MCESFLDNLEIHSIDNWKRRFCATLLIEPRPICLVQPISPFDVNYCEEGTYISWEIFEQDVGDTESGKESDEQSQMMAENNWQGFQIA